MRLFFLIIAIHFLIGGLGIHLLNKKLAAEARKKNWVKYVFYLLIFILVLSSILINKNAFLAISLAILSISLLELLEVSKLPCKSPSRNRIVFISMAIFSVLTLFYSLFIFLPSVIIAYVYTLVIIFDGASQIAGQALGKRKILPILSPNKTWEGLAGGTLSAVITSVVLHNYAGFSVSRSFIFGLLVCMASFMGDLAASAFKRFFNTKDFGVILPGQGGILDRFDSFIASGALVGLTGLLISSSQFQTDRNIAVYLGYSIVFMIILLVGEFIQNRFKTRPEYSRIFSHVMAGVACLFMTNLFTSEWYIISICIQSAMFMYITKRMGLFSSHHKVVRKTNGSSFFFVGVLAVYLISEMKSDLALYIIPVTVLTISDPLASVTGLSRRSGFWPSIAGSPTSAKTYTGSVCFFISALIITLTGLSIFYDLTSLQLIIVSLSLSAITTITEVISPNGTDNLSIPLVLSVSLIIFTT